MLALRKVGAFFSLWLVISMPAMACFDYGDMTAADRECCNQMAEKCGSMGMPQSHSCCTTKIHSSNPTIVRNTVSVTPVLATLDVVPFFKASDPILASAVQGLAIGSPPGSPPDATTVLRI